MTAPPPGSCDCHIHVFDSRFPLAPGAPYTPAEATADMCLAMHAALGIDRTVVVAARPYGTDTACLEDTLRRYGPDRARGIVKLAPGTPDAELARLTDAGVRGARFQMAPGDPLPLAAMTDTAARGGPLGWHVQLRLNGHELPAHRDALLALPGILVIDHIGRFNGGADPDAPGFRALLDLLDGGRCWVKLSAPYLSSADGPPGYGDSAPLARALAARCPERMVWATDWPHTGNRAGPVPDPAALLALLDGWVPDAALRRRILVDNPAALYGF